MVNYQKFIKNKFFFLFFFISYLNQISKSYIALDTYDESCFMRGGTYDTSFSPFLCRNSPSGLRMMCFDGKLKYYKMSEDTKGLIWELNSQQGTILKVEDDGSVKIYNNANIVYSNGISGTPILRFNRLCCEDYGIFVYWGRENVNPNFTFYTEPTSPTSIPADDL